MEPVAFDESDRPDETRNISLSRRDLRDAIRLLRRLVQGDDRPLQFEQTGGPIADRQTVIKRARRALSDRYKRNEMFGRAMFGEPAWDMLLILYIEQDGVRHTLRSLTEASGASPSTVLRWLEYLEAQGFVRRLAHPTDRRTFFIGLTDRGLQALNLYFSETLIPVR